MIDHREQVLDAMTAYQITSMMEGVVQARHRHGHARGLGKPIAGKTGTTNDEKDAWFVGFSPDLVVGVYVGYDKPRNLGRKATGGHLAAPIAHDFMKVALADKPAIPFRMPAGIKLVRVDSEDRHARRAGQSGRTILEAFKPGTAPPDNYSVIGVADADGRDRTAAARRGPQPVPARHRRTVLTIPFRRFAGAVVRAVCLMLYTIALCGVRRYITSHRSIRCRAAVREPCALKSNTSSKRSSSQSGC